jgi:hypothetical protein
MALLRQYDSETKQKYFQPKTPTSRQFRSNVESVLICLFDTVSIVRKEFFPPEQTVNGKFNCEFLRWLRQNILRKRPDNLCNKSCVLELTSRSSCGSCLLRKRHSFSNLPTHWTSPTVSVSYSPRWNWGSRSDHLSALERSESKSWTWWRRCV